MYLHNSEISIIPLKKNTLKEVLQLRNDPNTAYYLTSITPINEYMQEEWFKKVLLDNKKLYLGIENNAKVFLGIVRCDEWDKVNRSIRIGIDIKEEFRRKGIATQSYKLLLDYLFKQMGLHRVWLLVAEYNDKAIALYRKLGFQIEGKQRDALFRDGSFYDYHMYSILESEYDKKL